MTSGTGRGPVAWLALALILVSAAPARAASALDAIRERGVLRIGVRTDAPPFGSVDAGGQFVGFEIDLARLLARVLFDDEARARFSPVTAATRFQELQAGGIDLALAAISATDERRTVAELSDPYFVSASRILVAREARLASLDDAAGRRVAVVAGSVQERDVPELQPRAVVVVVASPDLGARAVTAGQVDAFVHDDVTLLERARRDPSLRVTGGPIRPRPYVAAAPKGHEDVIRWVNGWLAKMRRDGSYDALWRRYFKPFASHLVGV